MGSPYKTVAFQTIGCKLNFAETSTLARSFLASGYAQVNPNDAADLYVINTCSVTDNANKKARKAIRNALKKSPNAKVAVVGCYAQLKPNEIAKIPGVSIVLGTEEKFNLVDQINSYDTSRQTIILNSNINSVLGFESSYSFGDRTRSFLKIQDGCNYNCTFCTIPLARGKSRSANINQIIQQVKKIAESKIKEIVLTGVNVGDFGADIKEDFISLIKTLDNIDGIDRYRISSIEPNLLTNEIIDFISTSNKFLPHFHVPLQSGSDKILKKMKRRYNTDLYFDKIFKIKKSMPHASIGVDVIVGFPEECDTQFNKTYEFINELDISYLHVFPYSERENTIAVNMKNKIPFKVISERSKILQNLSKLKKKIYYTQNLGATRSVLVESFEDGFLYGYTENYIPVKFIGYPKEINEIIKIKLEQIDYEKVIGNKYFD